MFSRPLGIVFAKGPLTSCSLIAYSTMAAWPKPCASSFQVSWSSFPVASSPCDCWKAAIALRAFSPSLPPICPGETAARSSRISALSMSGCTRSSLSEGEYSAWLTASAESCGGALCARACACRDDLAAESPGASTQPKHTAISRTARRFANKFLLAGFEASRQSIPREKVPAAPRRCVPPLFGIVKNHAERVALATAQPAHAVPQIHAIRPAGALDRPVVHRENHALALGQRHDFGARLQAWALLGEQECASGEIATRPREQEGRLQRKCKLAVEVLMQAIEIACHVFQQQRRGARLSSRMALAQKYFVNHRIARLQSHPLVPAVGNRRETWIERSA